jgi:hypothetical protein
LRGVRLVDGVRRMTIAAANPSLPNRPRSLVPFLALWMVSYLAPCLAAWTVVTVVGLAYSPNDDNPKLFPHVARAVWIVLWPAGLALGQWMLMRRYLPRVHFWALATFAGALLERVTWMFMPHASAKTIGSMPPLSWIFQLLQSMFGGEIAPDALTVFAIALCLGAAWSVPSAFALPGTRSARVAWVVALTLTILVVSVIGASLAQELETQFLGSYPKFNYPIGFG